MNNSTSDFSLAGVKLVYIVRVINNFNAMEGFKAPEVKLRPTDEPKVIESREDKISDAEKRVKKMFDIKLSENLDRVGKNPYFEEIEQNS
jgi:hypothetical protein